MSETLSTVPRHRPDLEAHFWADPLQGGAFRQFNFYAWPYECPTCHMEGELRVIVSRHATDKQRHDAFTKQRAAYEARPDKLCPRCRKRAEERGQPEGGAADVRR